MEYLYFLKLINVVFYLQTNLRPTNSCITSIQCMLV